VRWFVRQSVRWFVRPLCAPERSPVLVVSPRLPSIVVPFETSRNVFCLSSRFLGARQNFGRPKTAGSAPTPSPSPTTRANPHFAVSMAEPKSSTSQTPCLRLMNHGRWPMADGRGRPEPSHPSMAIASLPRAVSVRPERAIPGGMATLAWPCWHLGSMPTPTCAWHPSRNRDRRQEIALD